MAKSIEERYLAEQKQAEIDHHQPTAGAMADHVLANLRVLTNKLVQAAWYVKGPSYFADREYLLQLQTTLNHDFVQLGDQLRAVGEKPASVTAEFSEYSMLTEDPRIKYYSSEAILAGLVADCQTSLMFIQRAVALANQESKFPLASYLIELNGQFDRASQKLQARLGKEPREGLEEEDDDDD